MKKNDIPDSSEATGFVQFCWSEEFVEESYIDQARKISQGQLLNALAFQTKEICPSHTL